ncbi:GNAT family N-acetyltransferase [Pseudomonas versuta]|uniref:GNAT family N-acetyltransferase n=1 Tax=Pseudomonas versuta TaxID=1788301 RepID=A0A853ZSI2_9PSED|nr:GNAT family N-acetyltransferase [Pseudomonas versuta]OKA17451.1 GNAT family N-acetyltransferase [Pseudomonas versuta]
MTLITYGYSAHLRTWRKSDIPGYAELAADSQVMKYISNGKVRTYREIETEVDRFQQLQRELGISRWVVTRSDDNIFLGYSGLEPKEFGINFGMRFQRKWWGTPWPLIGAHLALRHAFDDLNLNSVYSLTNVSHVKAIQTTMKYLNIRSLDDDIHQTPYGPHRRIIYTKALFDANREKNEARIERVLHRYLRMERMA